VALPHEHDDYFDRGICVSREQIESAILPPEVKMRIESMLRNPAKPIVHRDAADNGAVFLPIGPGLYELQVHDYEHVKEALGLA